MKASETSQRTYARLAGFTFLFYIAAGISSMALGSECTVDRFTGSTAILFGARAGCNPLYAYLSARTRSRVIGFNLSRCRSHPVW